MNLPAHNLSLFKSNLGLFLPPVLAGHIHHVDLQVTPRVSLVNAHCHVRHDACFHRPNFFLKNPKPEYSPRQQICVVYTGVHLGLRLFVYQWIRNA